MWGFPTSMRSVVRGAVVVGVVVVAVVVGFLGGWYAHTGSSSSSAAGTATLSIIGAGSLAPILPAFASAFANATPGVSAPAAAQLFEGSTAAASALTLPNHCASRGSSACVNTSGICTSWARSSRRQRTPTSL